MDNRSLQQSHKILFMNTLAFTVCFACWMLNGVLVTYLVDNGIFNWSVVEVGWLIGIPVLTGSIFRLPLGIWTDKFGGRKVFSTLLVVCAIPMFLLSRADSYWSFFTLSFLFGMVGTSFAVGVAYTSVCYPKEWQGRALGIFGMGNAGAAITTLFAPTLLKNLTLNDPDGWRTLPVIYAAVLVTMGVLFWFITNDIKPAASGKSLSQMLTPLKSKRVWRFGLYYYLVFGCFVAFSQWLVPYCVNVYQVSLVLAGIFASIFSLPSGVIRAAGGWLSDKFGARQVMYWVLGSSVVISFLLIIPRMEIFSPGFGVMAKHPGTVTLVTDSLIKVNDETYLVEKNKSASVHIDEKALILPTKNTWQEPVVKVGDVVKKKQLLAKGTTRIYFQANVWVFIVLVFLIGIVWGIGKAAVYKHIPEYFPNDVGVVGGMVGLIGGLGGFINPIVFGYLLQYTGLWTSSWILMFIISMVSLWWMHSAISAMIKRKAPELAAKIEHE